MTDRDRLEADLLTVHPQWTPDVTAIWADRLLALPSRGIVSVEIQW